MRARTLLPASEPSVACVWRQHTEDDVWGRREEGEGFCSLGAGLRTAACSLRKSWAHVRPAGCARWGAARALRLRIDSALNPLCAPRPGLFRLQGSGHGPQAIAIRYRDERALKGSAPRSSAGVRPKRSAWDPVATGSSTPPSSTPSRGLRGGPVRAPGAEAVGAKNLWKRRDEKTGSASRDEVQLSLS